MAVDSTETAFLVLLLVYMVYSQWARLDSRLPIVGGIALILIAAVLDADQLLAAAQVLALYGLFLLGGGTVLILVDHGRAAWGKGAGDSAGGAHEPAADPPDQGNPAPEQPFHRLEQ